MEADDNNIDNYYQNTIDEIPQLGIKLVMVGFNVQIEKLSSNRIYHRLP